MKRGNAKRLKRGAVLCIGIAMAAAAVTGCTKSQVTNEEIKNGGKSLSGSESADYSGSESTDYFQYVTLGEYKGIQVEPIVITDEDLQTELSYQLEQDAAVSEVTDRAAAIGDVVNIDYVGTIDGVEFEGGSYQGDSLELGSGAFIEGFEEGLVGVMPGDTIMIPLTFPEDYWDAEMAGQEAEFAVTINYIEEVTSVPDFTDELVIEWTGGELTTTKQYEDWLRNQMEMDALNYRRSQYMQTVMSNSQINALPEDRVEAMVQEITDYHASMVNAQYGISLEEYISASGMTQDEFEEELYPQAEESVAQLLVVLAIADAEGITITDEECEEQAIVYGYTGFSDVIEQYGEERAKEIVLMDKVIDMMMDE